MDLEKHGLDWLGYKIPVILTGIVFIVAGLFSGVALYILDLFYNVSLRIFSLPVVFFSGGIAVMALKKPRQIGKQIFAISFALILAFSFLSGDALPHASRYPMKLFAEKILSEKFSGPIVVYQLGNQRARLGVLTGQTVLTIHSPSQLEEFLATEKKVRIVMRQEDFKDKFPDVPLKIVAEDIAWLDGRIDWERMKELWEKAESANFSNLTEKIYLLTNK
ncbi:MAG: hypothetical protein HOJ79_04040 [Nitrospina sp.]|nr:hypothetical protein [Nitrospina sp.]